MNEFRAPKPDDRLLELLKGETESVMTRSNKPNANRELTDVRIVREGAGMVGLPERAENKEWSGLFNHFLKTARVATYLATELRSRGENVDPEIVLSTILVSHAGRRQFDEASWYPDAVQSAAEKKQTGDTNITLNLLEQAGVSQEIIENVKAHGVGISYPIEKMDTWEKKLAIYADYRVSQKVISLDERIEDFASRGIAGGRITQEQLDSIRPWIKGVEEEIFSILSKPKGRLGQAEKSLSPADINEDNPPPARWERYLRRLYINDAEMSIFQRLSELQGKALADPAATDEANRILDREFPENTWWGDYVRELFASGKNLEEVHGIQRAINFFKHMREERDRKGLET